MTKRDKRDLILVIGALVIAAAVLTSCYPTKMRANYGKTCPTFRK